MTPPDGAVPDAPLERTKSPRLPQRRHASHASEGQIRVNTQTVMSSMASIDEHEPKTTIRTHARRSSYTNSIMSTSLPNLTIPFLQEKSRSIQMHAETHKDGAAAGAGTVVTSALSSALSIASASSQGLLSPPLQQQRFLRHWILGFCVVQFDLELGPIIECQFPPRELTKAERTNICFGAFPDANAGLSGDLAFCFRYPLPVASKSSVSSLCVHEDNIFAYVCFRQVRDRSNRRGYFQKSLVLLTRLPFVGLWSKAVTWLLPVYIDMGISALEAACRDIASWPAPVHGNVYDVSYLGRHLRVELPRHFPASVQLRETSCFNQTSMNDPLSPHQILAQVPPTSPLFFFCRGASVIAAAGAVSLTSSSSSIGNEQVQADWLEQLWTLWELVLLGEPLVVYGGTPAETSEMIVALVDLIKPIPFGGDFRPYLTIQDHDFKSLICTPPPPYVMVGVTNPFFTGALRAWPHVLRLGRAPSIQVSAPSFNAQTPTKSPTSSSIFSMTSPGRKWSSSQVGLHSKHRRFVACDKQLRKQVQEALDHRRSPEIISNLLRRHFLQLTEHFLAPFQRDLSKRMPSLNSPKYPFVEVPAVRPFDETAFMKNLFDHGTPLLFRTRRSVDWHELYRRFLKTPSCLRWLDRTSRQTQAMLRERTWNAMCQVPPASLLERGGPSLLLHAAHVMRLELASTQVQRFESLSQQMISLRELLQQHLDVCVASMSGEDRVRWQMMSPRAAEHAL